MSHIQSLFSSSLVTVRDHACTVRRDERTPARGGMPTHVKLVRRGCFYCHLGSHVLLADSSVAYVQDGGREYRSSHPCDGGDDCTLIELEPELLAEVFGPLRDRGALGFSLSVDVQFAHLAAYNRFRRGVDDRLAGQEMALDLLRRIGRQGQPAGCGGMHRRRVVDAAKACLNRHLDRNIDMADVAREAGCSPYHLMRLFRAETGLALRAYRSHLRVAGVLERMAEGADDLSELAFDFGFSSHSHLTETFRRLLGAPPREIRARLSGYGGRRDSRRYLAGVLASAA